jgi:hypothetical protein
VGKARPATTAWLVISLPVLVGIFIYGPFVLDLTLHRRPPTRFLIPSGYVGWIRIEYRVANASALPREGKFLLARVDHDAKLQTSSDLPDGWAHDQFYYYSGNQRQSLSNAGCCKGGMIWGEVTEKSEKSGMRQEFFVGSEDQFRREIDPAGKMYSPCG